MKIIRMDDLHDTDREIRCPRGGFTSLRALLNRDGMGFTITKTIIPAGLPQHWRYSNHLEACYCIHGYGILTDLKTGQQHNIVTDYLYVLDQHDDHTFQAKTEVILLCVFNPPLDGKELHNERGEYELSTK